MSLSLCRNHPIYPFRLKEKKNLRKLQYKCTTYVVAWNFLPLFLWAWGIMENSTLKLIIKISKFNLPQSPVRVYQIRFQSWVWPDLTGIGFGIDRVWLGLDLDLIGFDWSWTWPDLNGMGFEFDRVWLELDLVPP